MMVRKFWLLEPMLKTMDDLFLFTVFQKTVIFKYLEVMAIKPFGIFSSLRVNPRLGLLKIFGTFENLKSLLTLMGL